MRRLFLLFFCLISLISKADDEKKFGIELNGYVKTDFIFDSRQTVCFREGQFYLYPQNELLDYYGNDINARPVINILAIQTRLTGKLTGPDAFGAKTSGLIEGSFFGNSNANMNVFRLRHAFVKLTWEHAEFMAGQFWHPMFETASFPETVSFNTGAPFQPFSRNPQLRFTKKFGKLSFSATLMEQIDFLSNGPDGLSPKYMKNSTIPEMNILANYKSDKFLAGFGGNFKSLMPRLLLETADTLLPSRPVKVKTDERVWAKSIFGLIKYSSKNITYKLYGVYGQEMSSMTGIGGYTESGYIYETYASGPPVDSLLTSITYTPITTISAWSEIMTNGKSLQIGIFAGYTKILGAPDNIAEQANYYGRGIENPGKGSNYINYIYRISPRIVYNTGKFRIAPEFEYTVAAYATRDTETGLLNIDDQGKVVTSKEIPNYRFLLGIYYMF